MFTILIWQEYEDRGSRLSSLSLPFLSSSTRFSRFCIFSLTQSPPATSTSSGTKFMFMWNPLLVRSLSFVFNFSKSKMNNKYNFRANEEMANLYFLSYLWIHLTTSTWTWNREDLSPKASKKFDKLSTKQALLACTTQTWSQALSLWSNWRSSFRPVQSPMHSSLPFQSFSSLLPGPQIETTSLSKMRTTWSLIRSLRC